MQSKTLFITFGCSWTYGVGVHYQAGMIETEYRSKAWDQEICDRLSFRGLLAEKYNVINKNFASPGSSNQRQFRLAEEFFTSREFKKIQNKYSNIVVLWGITSTARYEMFNLENSELQEVFLTRSDKLSKALVKYSYNHDNEIRQLATKIKFWNKFFQSIGILNFWFDTFNHHDYNKPSYEILNWKKQYETVFAGPDWPTWEDFLNKNFSKTKLSIVKEIILIDKQECNYLAKDNCIENFINYASSPRDLMSMLSINNGLSNPDTTYHSSTWEVDCERANFLVKQQLLNPISNHPTMLAHEQIANFFSPYLESALTSTG